MRCSWLSCSQTSWLPLRGWFWHWRTSQRRTVQCSRSFRTRCSCDHLAPLSFPFAMGLNHYDHLLNLLLGDLTHRLHWTWSLSQWCVAHSAWSDIAGKRYLRELCIAQNTVWRKSENSHFPSLAYVSKCRLPSTRKVSFARVSYEYALQLQWLSLSWQSSQSWNHCQITRVKTRSPG